MKNLIFVLFCIVFVSVICFSHLVSAVVPAPVATGQTNIFSGKVKSVSLGDPAKGTTTTITIVNERGEKLSIKVKPETVINDKAGEKISLEKIKIGEQVVVEYIETEETIEKAESIKLTEQ